MTPDPAIANAAHSDRALTASERHKAAMMAIAKIGTEAAKGERAMWLRFVKQVNAMTRSTGRASQAHTALTPYLEAARDE